jgi:hypothetical protein
MPTSQDKYDKDTLKERFERFCEWYRSIQSLDSSHPQRDDLQPANLENFRTAINFYTSRRTPDGRLTFPDSNPTNENITNSQMLGIDFSKEVVVVDLPTKLGQSQPVMEMDITGENTERDFYVGNYWSKQGQSVDNLGVSKTANTRYSQDHIRYALKTMFEGDAGDVMKTGPVERSSVNFEQMDSTQAQPKALRSTAADILDNWSTSTPIVCKGGAEQWFCPEGRNVMKMEAGEQKKFSHANVKPLF